LLPFAPFFLANFISKKHPCPESKFSPEPAGERFNIMSHWLVQHHVNSSSRFEQAMPTAGKAYAQANAIFDLIYRQAVN